MDFSRVKKKLESNGFKVSVFPDKEAASAYLLMPTERHLPSRKGHENYPPRVFNNCLHLCINSSLSSICSITSWQTIRSN